MAAAVALDDSLRHVLDQLELEQVVEYAAARLGMETGERYLTFKLTNGRLRETQVNHTHISNTQLRELDRADRVAA